MSEVYANILESLTSGLYNKIDYAIREYMQNAYDAIKEAKKIGLPEPPDGFNVKIDITKNNSIITITDNGIGMSDRILREYTSIGGGTKNDPDLTGHKGIGKLSGLRFFEKFVVRTKVVNADSAYELSWESGPMMKTLLSNREEMKKISYKDFIKKYIQIKKVNDYDKSTHFTQIQLIDVFDEFKNQVNEVTIGTFIKNNCPVPFLPDDFTYNNQITTWLGRDCLYISSYINDKVIYQPFKDEDGLRPPIFNNIKYNDKLRAKAWLSWIKDTSEIVENEAIRGIKFRCKGICVGNANLFANNCMPPGRDYVANWFTGEVIILDDDIKPNTARDGFYEGENLKKFYSEIKNKIGKDLSLIADIRSTINTARQDLQKLNNTKKQDNKNKANLLKKINDTLKTLKRYKAKDTYGFNFKIIAELEAVQEKEKIFEIEKLPKKTREVDEIIQQGNKGNLVDKLLELKGEETKVVTKEAKKALEDNIEKISSVLKENPATYNSENKDEMEYRVTLDNAIDMIVKYLKERKISYDKEEVKQFVINELNNG